MFEILFGWRKASKCKKLIRRVQCRLKLLKNKRCAIVRQVREDVAQLLKYGHDQTAFNRVEQLFKDESIVAVYDLLDHFCEFIIIHLSYIRRHKDCPNDINEAMSSLIFASARFGDLPELPVIRKLFGERYGARFAKTALELLPGNLVNRQIRDNLSIKSVPDEVKYKLVDEIARSCLPMRPLAIEYSSELHQQLATKNNGDQETNIDVQANKSSDDQVRKIDVRASYNNYEESQLITEGKIVHVDVSSERNKSSAVPHALESSVHDMCMVQESASDTSSHMQEELIYLDDVEEFQSPHSRDGNSQDQRLFMFKSSVFPIRDRNEGDSYKGYTKQYESWNEKAGSRRLRNTRKAARKRLRNPSFYWENRSVKDVECEKLSNGNCKSHFHPRKHQKKLQMENIQVLGQPCYLDGKMVNSSSEHPCYPRVIDLKNPPWQPKQPFLIRDLKEESVQYGMYYCPCSCNRKLNNNLIYPEHLSTKNQKFDCRGSNSPYLRAMTMPPERPNDSATDNILRSNSFPFREPSQFSNGTSCSPHVHPKMPDYDELAAKFMALKKTNLQNKHPQVGKPKALV